MRLGQLIKDMAIHDFQGDPDLEIKGLAYDSRMIRPGAMFVAIKGHAQDGHHFIQDAISKGAVAVVCEWAGDHRPASDMDGLPIPKTEHIKGLHPGVVMLKVPDTREALSRLAVRFFERPFAKMNLIGITGTNGKTTTSYLLESILMAAGRRPGVIGTINYRCPAPFADLPPMPDTPTGQAGSEGSDFVEEAPVTTPESLDLMRTLRRMADSDVTDVVMEVSSHSLDQGRVRDCPFRVAIFTNLSRDHLDYHQSMAAYFEAKALLFKYLQGQGGTGRAGAVINADDPKGRDLIRQTDARVVTYGMGKGCDVRAEDVKASQTGLTARLMTPQGETDIASALIGKINIYNILAAAAGASALGIDLGTIRSGLMGVQGVPGRLERVKNMRALTLIVDYAHTPDALLKVLETVRSLAKGRVLTVFGCGGDRDRGKRREMGRVAGLESDRVYITSDNPRTEDPAAIAEQIERGVVESGLKDYILDLDRENAIRRAVRAARNGDIVLIAGKGHETYQVIGRKKRPFDDRVVAAEAANENENLKLETRITRSCKDSGLRENMPAIWSKITVREILGPIRGSLISGDPETILTGINTDSRSIRPGELFCALKGERYDGHAFAPKALEQGACGILVQNSWFKGARTDERHGLRALGLHIPLSQGRSPVVISVENTLEALGDLAAWWRRRHDLQVVAITGSSGKTTTKEMVAGIFKIGHVTLKNQGNFNNLIGLPLTLLKLEPIHEKAVLEMGMNRPGEIARLTDIADPDVGVILNVGMAHLEGLSNLDGVAKAKTELIERISSEGQMILNGDDVPLMKRASTFPKDEITFGFAEKNDVTAANVEDHGSQGFRFDLRYRADCWPAHVRVPGRHNLNNALAAAAVGFSVKEPPENILKGLESFSGTRRRFEISSLSKGIVLVDDTYNANPSSLAAALRAVKSLVREGGRIIVGLGEMLELGETTIEAHRTAGRRVAETGAYHFFAMGEQANEMINSARMAGIPGDRAKVVETHEEMVKRIKEGAREGDLVLLKGSRRMAIDKVADGLHGLAHRD